MASTSDIVESLSQSISCPVCFMVFDKPRSLPCGHTFCLDCVQQVRAQIPGDEYYYDSDYDRPANVSTAYDTSYSLFVLFCSLKAVVFRDYLIRSY